MSKYKKPDGTFDLAMYIEACKTAGKILTEDEPHQALPWGMNYFTDLEDPHDRHTG